YGSIIPPQTRVIILPDDISGSYARAGPMSTPHQWYECKGADCVVGIGLRACAGQKSGRVGNIHQAKRASSLVRARDLRSNPESDSCNLQNAWKSNARKSRSPLGWPQGASAVPQSEFVCAFSGSAPSSSGGQ